MLSYVDLDENGELVDNDLVEELRSDKKINDMLIENHSMYDSLFVDDSIAFEYKGFADASKRASYLDKIEIFLILLKAKLGRKYVIVNDIDI